MTIGVAPGILLFMIALVLTGLAWFAFGPTVAFFIFAGYAVVQTVGMALS